MFNNLLNTDKRMTFDRITVTSQRKDFNEAPTGFRQNPREKEMLLLEFLQSYEVYRQITRMPHHCN